MPEEKPDTCEWGKCKKKPIKSVVFEDDKYWFCGDEHLDEFCQWVQQSGNY